MQQTTTPSRATRRPAEPAGWLPRRPQALAALALAAGLAALCGCAAPPPGSQNQETHRGPAVVPGGGTPGINGPYNLPGLAPVGAHVL